MKNYTLNDIAKELNVSRGTIDRVIHKRGGIGDETTKKVLDYLNTINFKPNKIGRGLAKMHENNIFVSFHDTKNEFFVDVKRGIQTAADEIVDFGFRITSAEVSRDSEKQLKQLKEAIDNGVNAIVLSPYEPEKFVDVIDYCAKKNIPVVTYNNDVANSSRLCYVGVNYYKNGKMAGEVLGKLVKTGTVAILGRRSSYWQNQQRITGFCEVIDNFKKIKTIGTYKDFVDYDTSYTHMRDLIKANDDLKGIYTLNNESNIICGVCDAVNEFSQGNIDIVTLDLPSAIRNQIKLGRITATICQDPFSQGYYSIKILYKYLFDNEIPKRTIFDTRLDVIYNENIDNYSNDLYII